MFAVEQVGSQEGRNVPVEFLTPIGIFPFLEVCLRSTNFGKLIVDSPQLSNR